MTSPRPITRKVPLMLALASWLMVVGAGLTVLVGYQSAPGKPAEAPAQWPAATALPHAESQPTLLVFAHPQCACTRATLNELDRLMRHVAGRVQATVVFLHPTGFDSTFVHSDLWARAQRLEGVTLIEDPSGTEAQQFRSYTSGQTLLYDVDGSLLFSGGLTASRGHEGDNIGRKTLHDLIAARATDIEHSNVFGCPLEDAAIDRENIVARLARSLGLKSAAEPL